MEQLSLSCPGVSARPSSQRNSSTLTNGTMERTDTQPPFHLQTLQPPTASATTKQRVILLQQFCHNSAPLHTRPLLIHICGKTNFCFLCLFFFFFHFIVFHPLAPHAALLEFCSAIPADVSLNQPSPPHCVRRISAGYSAITHRKWYIPPVNHPYVPRVLCSPLCMEWENIGKRVLCSPLLPVDEQTGEWVRGIRVKVRVRVGVHSYTPHPQSHHSEPSPTSNFINLSFPRTPRWRTRVTSGPVAHLLANFFFPAGTKFRTITANVTVTEKPSTCSP